MGWRSNEEPVGNTCPIIDSVIRDVNDIYNSIENPDDSNERDLKNILDHMEEIRSANSSLRSWGNDLIQERDDKQKTIDELEKKIGILEANYESLESERDSLERKIEAFESEIKYFQDQGII